jgi:hypothetical protein
MHLKLSRKPENSQIIITNTELTGHAVKDEEGRKTKERRERIAARTIDRTHI